MGYVLSEKYHLKITIIIIIIIIMGITVSAIIISIIGVLSIKSSIERILCK